MKKRSGWIYKATIGFFDLFVGAIGRVSNLKFNSNKDFDSEKR